jgi:hypothetical protein
MDREADVIRSEMTQTRAELGRKITMLQSRARELSPRAYAKRHLPDYFAERMIGSVLLLVGARMVWKAYHRRTTRRERLRAAINARAGW